MPRSNPGDDTEKQQQQQHGEETQNVALRPSIEAITNARTSISEKGGQIRDLDEGSSSSASIEEADLEAGPARRGSSSSSANDGGAESTSIADRVLSRITSRSSVAPGPPPDGGASAWLVGEWKPKTKPQPRWSRPSTNDQWNLLTLGVLHSPERPSHCHEHLVRLHLANAGDGPFRSSPRQALV